MNDNEVNLDERCAAPGEDDIPLASIEISFALETWVTPDQQRSLMRILQEIVDSPANTPKEGVHWVSTTGSKANFSAIDCALLGKKVGPNPPANGEEPEHDNTILCFESSARGFVNAKERERILEERRPSEFTCPKCSGHAFGSHGEDEHGKHMRYCNGRGQRGKLVDGDFVPTEGPDEPRIRCDFTWSEVDDAKYGLKQP